MSEINLNVVILTGRLTKDPDLKRILVPDENDPDVTEEKFKLEFTLAVNGYRDRVDFFRCVAWDSTAENIAQWCRKGRKLAIKGRLRREQWDAEDQEGTTKKHDRTVVSVRQVEFLEKPRDQGEEEYPW